MGTLNQIEIPLPAGFKAPYENVNTASLFDGDNLVLYVPRQNYNAPNPLEKETLRGINNASVTITKQYYAPTIEVPDNRAIIHILLQDLQKIGNLDAIGITVTYTAKQERFIAIRDYHRLDSLSDISQGYALRVGSMNVEDLKGSFRSSSGLNHNRGTRINYTQTHIVSGSTLVDYRSIL